MQVRPHVSFERGVNVQIEEARDHCPARRSQPRAVPGCRHWRRRPDVLDDSVDHEDREALLRSGTRTVDHDGILDQQAVRLPLYMYRSVAPAFSQRHM